MEARIEQHIIGAYLSGRPLPAREAENLRPHDLDHPIAVHVMESIEKIRRDKPSATAGEVIAQIHGSVAGNGVTPAVMTGWCQQMISDHELAVMMRYAIVGGTHAEIRKWGETIAMAAAMPQRYEESDVRHYQQHWEQAIARRYGQAAFAFEHDPDRIAVLDRFSLMFPDPLPVWQPTGQRASAEEDILMHLAGVEGLSWAAAGVIDESLFTSAARREVFRAIERIDGKQEYGDERFSAISAEIMTSRSFGVANPGNDTGPGPALDIVRRICLRMSTECDPQQALALGSQLLAEDLRRSLNASWNEGIPYRHDTAPAELITPADLMTPDQSGPRLQP